ncbi:hypothetical protein EMMF5_004398 [Cystobasidiomycetes sp. EMM_F5]
MSFALLRFSASAVIAATVMLSASRRTSAAAIHAERSLSGGPAQATWQNFETNPALTTGGKCAYQQITGAWANGGHNVAVGGFSYSDCGKCIKMTNTANGKSSYAFIVDEKPAGGLDVGGDALQEMGATVIQDTVDNIASVSWEAADTANCQVAWVVGTCPTGKSNLGGYCG